MNASVELPEELMPHLREGAKLSRLSESDFVAVALAQSLARVLHDPRLEARSHRATGKGWRKFLHGAEDESPRAGDEIVSASAPPRENQNFGRFS